MAKKARREDFDSRIFAGIAHRGLHNEEFTENGLKAFKNALDHGFVPELDIHVTKDNELLVCHDDNLKRTTGKEGIIEELTLKEIKDGYRLLDGEEVPTFEEVLALVNETMPIVVELKVHEGNYKPLAKKAMERLSKIKDKKNITLISFDPRALLKCKGYGFTRGLLVCKEKPWTLKLRGFFEYLDLDAALVDDPRVIKYRRKGGIVNVWTIKTPEMLDHVRPYVDTITFQDMDAELVRASLLSK